MAYDDHVEEVFQSEMKRQESDPAAVQSLWDLVKHQLDEYKLLEIATKFPQFAKEAVNLADKVIERNNRERRFRDDIRAIGNDRL